jgi:hypothetical protein
MALYGIHAFAPYKSVTGEKIVLQAFLPSCDAAFGSHILL